MIVAEQPPGDAALVRVAPETPGCASHARRWVLAATILGSSLAFMMASIINVALPAIQGTFNATVAEMQWVASAYTVLLAALTLAGGAIGDRYGRRRAFQIGTVGLAAASIAGSFAPNATSLIAARAAQGLAAALLIPNSLALLSAAFPRAERGGAIGSWSAATALVGAVSPMVGGWFVDVGSWRVAFSTVIPPALVVLAVAAWRVPDPPTMRRAPPVDWAGAALATLGLFGVVTGIITIGSAGVVPRVALTAGAVALVAFVLHERRTPSPMVPPALFGSRAFCGVNVLTILVYGGVTGVFFVLPFDLVQVQGYSSTATGAAFLPFALLVGLLSRRVGGLADRIGTKPLLVSGAIVTAVGLASFAVPGIGGPYWRTFLVPMLVTGVGMALTAAPLTTSVLGSVAPADAGIASGVNNTAARVGTLLAVAIVGVVALAMYGRALDRRLAAAGVAPTTARTLVAERRGLADTTLPVWVAAADRSSLQPLVDAAFLDAFRGSVLGCAAFVLAGALVAAMTLPAGDAVADTATAAGMCDHVETITDVAPRTSGCGECLRSGDAWVHLRACLACGMVGCCDSSKNRHATKHFWESQHPIVRSLESGEVWRWCYVDEVVV